MSDDNNLPPGRPGDPDIPPTEPIPTTPPTEPIPTTPPTEPIPTTPPTEPIPTTPAGRPAPDALAAEQAAANAERAHWYDNQAAVGGVIAVGLLAVLLLIGWLIWWSDDDDDDLDADDATVITVETGSTLGEGTATTSSIPPASIIEGEIIDVTAPTTVAPTTAPTTTAAPTTAPATTAAPTTAPATTVAPTTAATTAPATTSTTVPVVSVPPSPSATVMDIIAASPDLSTLNAAIADAGLSDALGGEDAVTVFAPSDQAFETLAAAPGGQELLDDPERLEQLLLRHVVPGALDTADVLAATELETLQGDLLTVDATDQTVDGADLVVTDVEGANGFLHVVDAVLVPPPTS